MDSVHEKTTNLLEDIGGVWYNNQKQPKSKKINNISKIEKGI